MYREIRVSNHPRILYSLLIPENGHTLVSTLYQESAPEYHLFDIEDANLNKDSGIEIRFALECSRLDSGTLEGNDVEWVRRRLAVLVDEVLNFFKEDSRKPLLVRCIFFRGTTYLKSNARTTLRFRRLTTT